MRRRFVITAAIGLVLLLVVAIAAGTLLFWLVAVEFNWIDPNHLPMPRPMEPMPQPRGRVSFFLVWAGVLGLGFWVVGSFSRVYPAVGHFLVASGPGE